MIATRDLIAIIAAKVPEGAPQVADHMRFLRQRSRVLTVTQDEIASYVITDKRVYASPITTASLRRRLSAENPLDAAILKG